MCITQVLKILYDAAAEHSS